jgi:hypothetical protein
VAVTVEQANSAKAYYALLLDPPHVSDYVADTTAAAAVMHGEIDTYFMIPPPPFLHFGL